MTPSYLTRSKIALAVCFLSPSLLLAEPIQREDNLLTVTAETGATTTTVQTFETEISTSEEFAEPARAPTELPAPLPPEELFKKLTEILAGVEGTNGHITRGDFAARTGIDANVCKAQQVVKPLGAAGQKAYTAFLQQAAKALDEII